MLKVALLFYLLQVQSNPAPGSAPNSQTLPEEHAAGRYWNEQAMNAPDDDVQRRAAAYEEREFETRFNELLRAMTEFASTYNRGHVVDVKKAKAVRKAIRELEKLEWFRLAKTD